MIKFNLSKRAALLIFMSLSSSVAGQAVAANGAPWVGDTFWGTQCTGKPPAYGPFDYLRRLELSRELYLVEMAHFTPAVEQFVSGTTGKNPMGDLVYTLRAWPNHHRALNTIIKVRLQSKDVYQGNKKYPPAECFLQRAIHFSPEDATTYMLYGMLLQRMDKLEEAHAQYLKARELSPQDIQIKYNYALLLIKLNRIVEAEELARDIYAANYPLPGLRRQLERAGVKL